MTNELKPCPFCGGKAEYRAAKYVRTAFRHSVVCLDCFASIPPKDSEQEAIEAWNTRAERTCKNRGSYKGCSECGWYLNDNDRYCGGCGAKVVE